MAMEEYANKFLQVLSCVEYIREENVRVQCFISGLLKSYKEIIEFNEPQTLDETIRNAKYCYDQNKSKLEFHKAWNDKINQKFNQRKRGFKPPHFGNHQIQPTRGVTKTTKMMGDKLGEPL